MERASTFLLNRLLNRLFLDNLKQLLLHNVKQLSSNEQHNLVSQAKNELEELQQDLSILMDSLVVQKIGDNEDVLEKQYRDITEVVYELEDTIEFFITDLVSGGVRRWLTPFRRSHLDVKFQSLMVKLIPFIMEKIRSNTSVPTVKEIKQIQSNTSVPTVEEIKQIQSNTSVPTVEEIKDTSNKAHRQDNVVCLKDQMESLIKHVLQESDALEVISITGMAGIGKTTMASQIYNDPSIMEEFRIRIWVNFSQEFDRKNVFLSILREFTGEDMSEKSADVLSKVVYKFLSYRRFLMVMDDLWTVEDWEKIQDMLPKSHEGDRGRVLITSRNQKVAQRANGGRKFHKLRFLNISESWELLKLQVFGRADIFPPQLEKYGKIIAHKCDGLPLAILGVGGILIKKTKSSHQGKILEMVNKWEKMSVDINSHLLHGKKMAIIENSVSLSYISLSSELRNCFLYLGIFPENAEISTSKLALLWIAEGFIRRKPKKTLEEVAQENINDLIGWNLLMVSREKLDGEVKTCHVHKVIREFCKWKASMEKQDLFQEIKMSSRDEKIFEPKIEDRTKCRRLCIHSDVRHFISRRPMLHNIRSFVCMTKYPVDLTTKDMIFIAKAFSLVRVLEATSIKLPRFPSKVTDLIHLRYLTLSVPDLKIIPDAIFRLCNLETLMVDTLSPTLKIKADMWRLMKLRHLKTKSSLLLRRKQSNNAGGGKLQTLGNLSPQSLTDDMLNRVKNLKALTIHGKLSESMDMEKLESLRILKLKHDVYPNVGSEYPMQSLPPVKQFPQNLQELTLSYTHLDWKCMSTLGELRTVKVLKLKNEACMGNSWDVGSGGFLGLEVLYINFTDLMYWTALNDSFPELKKLILRKCHYLEEIPLELDEKLEVLDMAGVTKYAVSSARKIAQRKQEAQIEFKLIIFRGDTIDDN